MENKKKQLIKKYNLKENEKGLYKGFFCDGGYYDELKEDLYKMGFETVFYEDWYFIKYTLKTENLLFELIEGDLYLYDLNEYDTTLNNEEIKEFYSEIEEEEIKGLENLNFDEIEEYLYFDDDEKEKIRFLIKNDIANNYEEAKDKTEEVYIYEDWDLITDEYIENNFSEIPETAKDYLDREAIQRDLEINGSFYEHNNYIFEVVY